MQPLIMFALPIFMPRFKSINFYQNIPKIKLFLQKNAKFFCAAWASAPDPRASSGGWGFRSQALKTSPYCEFLTTRHGVFIGVMLFCVNRFCSWLMFMVFRKRLFL